MESKMRKVEMARMMDDGTWDTVMVSIPSITHPSLIEETARGIAAVVHGSQSSYALYNSYDDDADDLPARSELQVKFSFDLGEITVGSEREQQDAAIELVSLMLQREPYGLGAQISRID